jgi:teichuronic acid biosynthesis glycosyltransferase TuaC
MAYSCLDGGASSVRYASRTRAVGFDIAGSPEHCVKLLVIPSNYPHPLHPFAANFNQRIVKALNPLCKHLEVLAPRPYVPRLLSSFVQRWKAYHHIPEFEMREGVSVRRPAYPQLPHVGGAYWMDHAAFFWSREAAREMHRRVCFDAILALDLLGVGCMAWRIGQELGIPASAWVFGTDARVRKASSQGRAVARALQHSDVVFYQSHELLGKVAALLNSFQRQVLTDRHVVLPHGIPVPPALAEAKIRSRVRKRWGVADEQLLVLSIGRICRDKGIFELLDAIALATAKDSKICCVVVGSNPAFDETRAVQKTLNKMTGGRQKIKLLPAVPPEEIWECLCAADIFAFTSHHEGMPNSLLEAMAMGLPSVAFAIPPVREIESRTGAIVLVPPFDRALFAEALAQLANSSSHRSRIGSIAKELVFDRFLVERNMASAIGHIRNVVEEWSRLRATYPQFLKSEETQAAPVLYEQ